MNVIIVSSKWFVLVYIQANLEDDIVKEALKTVSKYLSLLHTLIYDIMYILYTVVSKIQMLSDHDGKIITLWYLDLSRYTFVSGHSLIWISFLVELLCSRYHSFIL